MDNSDKILENYIQKVLDLQKAKDAQMLSAGDLREIAINMGISAAELDKANEAYQTRGQGHLKYANYEDAAKEFKQLLILNPSNLEAMFGLAQAYNGLWNKMQRNDDKEHALSYAELCLQIDPNHQGSYQLISNLKRQQQGYQTIDNDPKFKSRATTIIVSFIVIAVVAMIGLITSIMFSTSNPSGTNLIKGITQKAIRESLPQGVGQVSYSQAAAGGKGSVFWLVSYQQKNTSTGFSRTHQLNIINPVNGKALKTILLAKDVDFMTSIWTNLMFLNNKFYWVNDKTNEMEARDMYSGEIVENAEILSKRYPELKMGIGEAKLSSGWFELTTRNGEKFWYFPERNFLASDAQKEAANKNYTDKSNWITQYKWYMSEGKVRNLYLFKNQESPYRIYPKNYRFDNSINKSIFESTSQTNWYGEMILELKDKVFLNGNIIYADEKYCFIRHDSEIGSNAKSIFTCVDGSGKILWEISEPESLMLRAMNAQDISSYQVNAYKDRVLLSRQYLQVNNLNYGFACEIDLKTGKVLWEYSPTYKGQ